MRKNVLDIPRPSIKSNVPVFGMLITIGQGSVYVYSGMYGDFADLGAGNAILLILQLFFAGILVIVWDELLQKGTNSLFVALSLMLNQATVSDLEFPFSLPPTFAKPSFGSPSPPPQSQQPVEPNSKEL